MFRDNQNGLLTANFADAELSIVDSVFGPAPRNAGRLTHLLYVGRIAKFSVRGSRFHGGFDGHLIKSRARENSILYNMIDDRPDGSASYEINLPNGGEATLVGNVIAQSPGTENPVVISYGEEGGAWDRNVLRMAHNTLLNRSLKPAWFLRIDDKRVPGVETVAINNLLVGLGAFSLVNSGEFRGNWPASVGMLRDVSIGAFELPPDSWLRGRGVDPGAFGAGTLAPRAEFEWPSGTVELPAGREQWSPGAYQR